MDEVVVEHQKRAPFVIELILIAAVLTLIGVALYQSNHWADREAAKPVAIPSVSSTRSAEAAARVIEQGAAAETEVTTEADSINDDFAAMDDQVTSLGGATDADSF